MQISDLSLSSAATSMSLDEIRRLVSADFAQVDQLTLQNLHSEVELIEKICLHIIQSGGKRLRPLLVLLSAKLFDYQGDAHIQLAVIIEFIHTATLLHDDVVDASQVRRGMSTANVIWGNQAPILVGDFLYSRVFQLLNTLQNFSAMQILANTTNAIAKGEVLQLVNKNNAELSEAHYFEVIRCKTAVLFSAAAELGAVIANRSVAEQQALAGYGLHLGMAFQMIDDLLDYSGVVAITGKNTGDDLADGKLTLPLIYALQHSNPQQAQLIRQAITAGKLDELAAIMQIVESTDALRYVRDCAQFQADAAKSALNSLEPSVCKTALLALAQLAVDRLS